MERRPPAGLRRMQPAGNQVDVIGKAGQQQWLVAETHQKELIARKSSLEKLFDGSH